MLFDATQHTLPQLVDGGGEPNLLNRQHSQAGECLKGCLFLDGRTIGRLLPNCRPFFSALAARKFLKAQGRDSERAHRPGGSVASGRDSDFFTLRNISDTYIYKAQFAKRNNTLQYD